MGRGRAYSHDLRIRCIYLINKYNLNTKAIREGLRVDPSTIRNYVRYLQHHGDTRSFSQLFGRKPRSKLYDVYDLKKLILLCNRFKGMDISRLRTYMFIATGKHFRVSTIKRMLNSIWYTYKKVSIKGYESDPFLVRIHYLGLLGLDRNRLYFGDETHISNKNGQCQYAWGPQGRRTYVEDVFVRRDRASIVGVIGIHGFTAHAIKEGSINKEQFCFFMLVEVYGALSRGDTLCLDNCAIHKNSIYLSIFEFIGVRIWWLPPYSPWTNPIEIVWNSVKAMMRSNRMRERTRFDPIGSANHCLQYFYGKDLSGLYKQCGY